MILIENRHFQAIKQIIGFNMRKSVRAKIIKNKIPRKIKIKKKHFKLKLLPLSNELFKTQNNFKGYKPNYWM